TPVPEGLWYAVNSAADLNNDDYYVIGSAQNNVFMTDECAGKYMKSGNLAQIKGDAKAEYISSVPEGTALLRLEHIDGNQYYIAVHDTHYNVSHGYLNSTATKTVNLTDDRTDTAKAAITISSSGEATVTFGNFGRLLYNSSSPRFTTYTSDQEHLRLFRMHDDISTGITSTTQQNMVTVYTIQGLNVGRGDEKEMLNALPSGLYIIVKQSKTYKIHKR
ncbi:MAG: hypothetical protein K2I91_03330, partial [Muribaculaceae bacterium]|nr:hypothetical protein [Muribaculaceae bacterium]